VHIPHVPADLQNLITVCQGIISQNEFNALPPYYRRQIYDFHIHNQGRNARFIVWIGVLATEKVIACWRNNFIEDYSPRALLDMALNTVLGSMDIDTAYFKYEWSQHILDSYGSRIHDPDGIQSYGVALAAHETLRTALGEEPFDNVLLGESEMDRDLDYTCSDPALYVAKVYAGAYYAENFDPDRSYEFWTWWVTEAVPKAWYAAQFV
jgi:hypothetical protein